MASRDLMAKFVAKDEMSDEIDRIRGSLSRLERQYHETDRAASAATGGADSFLLSVGKIASGIGVANIAMQGFGAAGRLIQESMVGMNASLETAELQFKILMGDADRAREHVKGLFEFAKTTPFETGPLIEASRLMQVMGGDALNTSENLRMIGDAAAGASKPIEEVTNWVSRAYNAIQAGRPFGEAGENLMRLGILSGEARGEMERLSEAGADSSRIWGVLTQELGRFEGSMTELQGTWAGLTSTFTDSVNILISGALKPLFEEAKAGLAEVNKILESDAALRWGEGVRDSLQNDVLPQVRTYLGLIQDIKTIIDAMPRPQAQTLPVTPDLLGGAVSNIAQGLRDKAAWEAEAERIGRETQQILEAGLNFEDLRLEQAIISAVGRELLAGVSEAVEQATEELAADNRAEDWMRALGLAELNRLMGAEGVKLVDAVKQFIDDGTPKSQAAAAQWADAIMTGWLEKLDPALATRRIAELQAAVDAAMMGDQDAPGRIAGMLRDVGAEDFRTRAQKDAERDAERARRAAETEAKREAERLEREAKREAEQLEKRIEDLRLLGERRADAINEATDAAAEAIAKAEEQRETALDKLMRDTARERKVSEERIALQKLFARDMQEIRDRQAGEQLTVSRGREDEDFALRRAREDEDRLSRRSRQVNTEQKDQEALNAARFRGNSLEILALLKQQQERRNAINEQQAEEERVFQLRRTRENEDFARRRGRQDEDIQRTRDNAAEIEGLQARQEELLDSFNRKLAEYTLDQKIQGLFDAEQAAINAANTRLADTEGRADRDFGRGVERLQRAGGFGTVNVYQTFNNYGVIGEDAIEDLETEAFDEAAQMLAQIG